MLWRRRDMGSDLSHPIYITTDIPVTDDECVELKIPLGAYKRLVDWCSMARTLDNTISMLAAGSPDEERTKLAFDEISELMSALVNVHEAIRRHYAQLPKLSVDKPQGDRP